MDNKTNQYVTGDETLALDKQKQSHARAVLKEDHSHEEEMVKLQTRRLECLHSKELGLLGKIFGGQKNSSKNITAFINLCIIIGAVLISAIVYINEHDKDFVKEIWTDVMPIVTLSLGYLFGKK